MSGRERTYDLDPSHGGGERRRGTELVPFLTWTACSTIAWHARTTPTPTLPSLPLRPPCSSAPHLLPPPTTSTSALPRCAPLCAISVSLHARPASLTACRPRWHPHRRASLCRRAAQYGPTVSDRATGCCLARGTARRTARRGAHSPSTLETTLSAPLLSRASPSADEVARQNRHYSLRHDAESLYRRDSDPSLEHLERSALVPAHNATEGEVDQSERRDRRLMAAQEMLLRVGDQGRTMYF